MTAKQKEMNELFSMFHDFEISSLNHIGNKLNLIMQIPWGQLWGDLNYSIEVELTGCTFVRCDYAEFENTSSNMARELSNRTSINKSTTDLKLISEIGLEIQEHEFFPLNEYRFLCNSSKGYAGGELVFTAKDYKLFNKEGVQIDIQQMKNWNTRWWAKVQRMWDEQQSSAKARQSWWQRLFGIE